jgi:hypothetical protein
MIYAIRRMQVRRLRLDPMIPQDTAGGRLQAAEASNRDATIPTPHFGSEIPLLQSEEKNICKLI